MAVAIVGVAAVAAAAAVAAGAVFLMLRDQDTFWRETEPQLQLDQQRGGDSTPLANPSTAHPEIPYNTAPTSHQSPASSPSDTPPSSAPCGVCNQETHVARECIRANADGLLAACTLCNSTDHLIDECHKWLQLSFEGQFRVCFTERAKLPQLLMKNMNDAYALIDAWWRTGRPLPRDFPWSGGFVKKLREEKRWNLAVQCYEGPFRFDASGNEVDQGRTREVGIAMLSQRIGPQPFTT
ncbi:hypothetical protein JDV02_004583 [Purpureocillium takamizusanense]|uniref:CCHC-type domain-containing protein n=1 Tax=Purpureocillium takamizusanense TaxID=2060973 RepID=A0A9Q8QCT3_9HYPO|nr:uncharacterized protein JDV02_004583 [Purpureocillium takamizusanense]UNI18309.1 hypothetical protein JDV02_004583 [Purpureocillium takamizusanense]